MATDYPTDPQTIFKSCTWFLRHHRPISPKEALSYLSEQVGELEGADNYGTGALIEEFETRIACLLCKEAAVFMPSGTMAQVLALRIWAEDAQNRRFGLHPTSHLELHEHQAYQHLHGLEPVFVGDRARGMSIGDFNAVQGRLASVIVELPQRELGGVLPAWEELTEMAAWAKRTGARFHLDGARLWEAQPYYGRSHAEICAHFDSVYVSFYKGLGGMAGAILAGSAAFIKEAKIWQRRQGGNLKVLFPYVISARAGLDARLGKMALYRQKALEIAKVLEAIDGIALKPNPPQTNMLHVYLQGERETVMGASLEIARRHRVALFGELAPGELPWFELSVGDATLELSTERISDLFRELMSLVRLGRT